MHRQMYCDVLDHQLKRSIAKLPDKGKIIYQQDLAPWYMSKMVKANMKKMKVKVLDWSTKSPDLNPIGFALSILDKKLMTTPIYNKAALRKRLEEEWKPLGIDLCCSLVDSMPERLKNVYRPKVEITINFYHFFEIKSRCSCVVLKLFSVGKINSLL